MKFNEVKILENGMQTVDWLDELNILHISKILPNGKVDVNGDVDLSQKVLGIRNGILPIKFGKINGNFDCRWNKLTSLEGCPEEVVGHFFCGDNELTTLEHGPLDVGGIYSCQHNRLNSFKGVCKNIGQHFYASGNRQITSLIGISDLIKSIGENQLETPTFDLDWGYIQDGGIGLIQINHLGQLTSDLSVGHPFQIISRYLGQPDQIFECQNELIDAGYEEYSEL